MEDIDCSSGGGHDAVGETGNAVRDEDITEPAVTCVLRALFCCLDLQHMQGTLVQLLAYVKRNIRRWLVETIDLKSWANF
ncbi:hypothetical protein E2C01_041743 [Portunus trituberculatus]|uniref:Uncharacterized protein n=1 Tax=Portunus trituberculatus TaxID=210409 RepID=A0A5B7FNC8_PORTR|nr:hypothetical protein [Portunus trituberculatus]